MGCLKFWLGSPIFWWGSGNCTSWLKMGDFALARNSIKLAELHQELRDCSIASKNYIMALTCLNPLYIVRISDLVNFVSFNSSVSCTVFLFCNANLCLTASWMSKPRSKDVVSGSAMMFFFAKKVFFARFSIHELASILLIARTGGGDHF